VRKKTKGEGFRDFGEMEQWSKSGNFEGECQAAMLSHH